MGLHITLNDGFMPASTYFREGLLKDSVNPLELKAQSLCLCFNMSQTDLKGQTLTAGLLLEISGSVICTHEPGYGTHTEPD